MQAECNFLHSGIVFEEFTSGDPHKIRGYARMQKLHSGFGRCQFGYQGAVTIGKLGMTDKIDVFNMCGVWAFVAVDVMAD